MEQTFMANKMIIRAEREEGLRFRMQTDSGHEVAIDAGVAIGGENSAPSPMEMLLVGLAGCMGVSVMTILRKSRQEIKTYEIHVSGDRTTEPPKIFTRIELEHYFTGENIKPQTIQRAIDLAEERYCGASAMLGKTAEIVHTVHIAQ